MEACHQELNWWVGWLGRWRQRWRRSRLGVVSPGPRRYDSAVGELNNRAINAVVIVITFTSSLNLPPPRAGHSSIFPACGNEELELGARGLSVRCAECCVFVTSSVCCMHAVCDVWVQQQLEF